MSEAQPPRRVQLIRRCGLYSSRTKGRWSRMKVVGYRVPVEIDRVTVRPGDIVFGDVDGVVVIPHEIETEVLTRALEKSRAEKCVRADIKQGLSATDALHRYGIL